MPRLIWVFAGCSYFVMRRLKSRDCHWLLFSQELTNSVFYNFDGIIVTFHRLVKLFVEAIGQAQLVISKLGSGKHLTCFTEWSNSSDLSTNWGWGEKFVNWLSFISQRSKSKSLLLESLTQDYDWKYTETQYSDSTNFATKAYFLSHRHLCLISLRYGFHVVRWGLHVRGLDFVSPKIGFASS